MGVVGLLSFYLLIAHIVLIIGGYASGQWSAVVSTVWGLITSYGGILLAVAGTAYLSGLGAGSWIDPESSYPK
jgi:hypothetical protein